MFTLYDFTYSTCSPIPVNLTALSNIEVASLLPSPIQRWHHYCPHPYRGGTTIALTLIEVAPLLSSPIQRWHHYCPHPYRGGTTIALTHTEAAPLLPSPI